MNNFPIIWHYGATHGPEDYGYPHVFLPGCFHGANEVPILVGGHHGDLMYVAGKASLVYHDAGLIVTIHLDTRTQFGKVIEKDTDNFDFFGYFNRVKYNDRSKKEVSSATIRCIDVHPKKGK